MDPSTLAHLVINAINQFGPFVGGAAASALIFDASADLYNKSKEQARHLIEAVRHRFQREPDSGSATNALQAYTGGDRDFESVVQTKLERILRDDPAFSADLLRIMRNGPLQTFLVEEEAKVKGFDMTNSAGTGTQHAQIGKKADVSEVRMNITSPDNL